MMRRLVRPDGPVAQSDSCWGGDQGEGASDVELNGIEVANDMELNGMESKWLDIDVDIAMAMAIVI